MPAGERVLEETLGVGGVGRLDAGDAQFIGHDTGELRDTIGARAVEQVVAVQMEAVEEEGREWEALGLDVGLGTAPEAAHRHLERVGSAVGSQRDHLAVEDHGVDGQRARRGDDLGYPVGDVREAPRERADLVAEPVHLQPRAVQLPFHGRAAGALDRRRDVLARSARAWA